MKKKITIVNYGSGNLLSAKQSFVKALNSTNIKADIQISENPKDLLDSTHVVLPGQGAFKTCMEGIKKISGMQDSLNEFVKVKSVWKKVILKDAVNGAAVPIHPGAAKYYKEQGVM